MIFKSLTHTRNDILAQFNLKHLSGKVIKPTRRNNVTLQEVIQENNFRVCRSKRRELGSTGGSDKRCKPPPARIFGRGAPLRKLSGFLRPIDWLKIDQNLVFFPFFSSIFFIFSFMALKNL